MPLVAAGFRPEPFVAAVFGPKPFLDAGFAAVLRLPPFRPTVFRVGLLADFRPLVRVFLAVLALRRAAPLFRAFALAIVPRCRG